MLQDGLSPLFVRRFDRYFLGGVGSLGRALLICLVVKHVINKFIVIVQHIVIKVISTAVENIILLLLLRLLSLCINSAIVVLVSRMGRRPRSTGDATTTSVVVTQLAVWLDVLLAIAAVVPVGRLLGVLGHSHLMPLDPRRAGSCLWHGLLGLESETVFVLFVLDIELTGAAASRSAF